VSQPDPRTQAAIDALPDDVRNAVMAAADDLRGLVLIGRRDEMAVGAELEKREWTADRMSMVLWVAVMHLAEGKPLPMTTT
jgi:hypothetical protein